MILARWEREVGNHFLLYFIQLVQQFNLSHFIYKGWKDSAGLKLSVLPLHDLVNNSDVISKEFTPTVQ